MSNKNNLKPLYFNSEEEEWEKVLSNPHLLDKIVEAFGDEVIEEYRSYKKIPANERSKILEWLRKKDYYYDELVGSVDEKTKPGKDFAEDLEKRIRKLEALFEYLRAKKGLEGCGSSNGE